MGILYRQIRSWAQKNNWYKTHIVSHKLWLNRNFGKEIRKKAVALEAAGAAALAGRIEREFTELLDVAGVFDALCKRGCASEEEFAEFERVKQQVRSEAFKLAQVLQTADKKPPRRSRIAITDDQGGRGVKDRAGREIVDIPPADEDGQWITLTEAGELAGKHPGTIGHWVQNGKIRDNGKKRRHRRIAKADILLIKQATEETDAKKDADEERQDKKRMDREL